LAGEKDAKIEKDRQLAEAGKFVSAISAWRELLDETPHNDANVYNTIGDLCLKNKATPDAIDAYGKAARFYLQEGFHLKAVALYKKILKLDPNRAEMYTLLGDLNIVRGLMNNAVADYLSGAKMYLKIGKTMNALTLFRKITKVDPQNTEMRLRVAELCLKEKLTEEAIDEYLRIGREYQRLGRAEEARKLYEQILKISPNHAEARRRLDTPYQPELDVPEPEAPALEPMTAAEAALETPEAVPAAPTGSGPPATLEEARRVLATGDVTEAERMIRLLLVDDPDRVEYQATLGLVYLKKGHTAIAYDILCPIAKAWAGEGRRDEALEIADAFLTVEPDEEDFLKLKARATGTPVQEVSGEAVREFKREEPVVETPPAPQPVERPSRKPAREAPTAAPEPAAQAVVPDVEAIWGEFRKGIKGQDGDEDIETHYDLGVAYKEMGLIAEAIEELQLAARGPTRFVDACAMIAACYKDQSLNKSAIAFLERVLSDAGCAGPGVPYVKYDLAVLYEEEGFTDKAIRLYEDILSIRDVEARLRRLQGSEEPMAPLPAGTKRPISYL
jgi:tetratricopeptide (TPR) repeat protein